jgi:hypothetical protein
MAKRRRKEAANVPTGPSKFDENRWKAEADLEALGRAYAVRKDPDRMKRAKSMAKEKLDENKRKKDEADHMIDLGEGEAKE